MKALNSISFITGLFLVGCGADMLRENTDTETNNTINPNTNTVDTGSIDTGLPVDTSSTDTGLPVDTSSTDTGLPVDTSSTDTGLPVDTSSTDTGLPVDTGSSDTGLPLDTGLPVDTGSVDTGSINTGSTDTGQPVDTSTIDTDTRPDCEFVCVNTGTCPASGVGAAGIPHREMSCGNDSQVCCDDHSQDPPIDTTTLYPECEHTCVDSSLCSGDAWESGYCETGICCSDWADTVTEDPVDTGTGEPIDTGTGDPVDTDTGYPYCEYTCLRPSQSCASYNGGIEHPEGVCVGYPGSECCDLTNIDMCALGRNGKTDHFNYNEWPVEWERSHVGKVRITNEDTKAPLDGTYLRIDRSNDGGEVYAISPSYDIEKCKNVYLSFYSRYQAYDSNSITVLVEWDNNGAWYPVDSTGVFDKIYYEYETIYNKQLELKGTASVRIKIRILRDYINIDNFHVYQVW
jgi:hypothetical protein